MVRSIQVFDITFPLNDNSLKKKLQTNKKIRIENKSYDYDITIKKIDGHNDGVIIVLSVDLKQNEKTVEQFVAQIYVSLNNGILIINALQPIRLIIVKSIIQLLFETDDPTEYFEIKDLEKDDANNIFKKIKFHNSKNFIYNPRFTFKTSGYGKDKLSYEGFSISNHICATEKSDYDDMYSEAKSFEPILKLYKCPNLVKYELDENPVILRIKNNYSFSQYIDNTFKDWIDFYYMITKDRD